MQKTLLYPICKINIGLYVVEKRPDGYHNLQTLFYPVGLTDSLEICEPRDRHVPYALYVSGVKNLCAPEDNIVVKTYLALKEELDLPPVEIFLGKRIPTGAGLGGGSSDAAEMIKGLNERFHLGLTDEDMRRRIARFGADCAFFIDGKSAYAEGIGDVLTPADVSLKGKTLVLVKPPVAVSTREAYSGVVPAQPEHDLRDALIRPIETWRETVSNDFERSVFRLHPTIEAIKNTLYDLGALYASMSGSGSTVFGIFPHRMEGIEAAFKDCFVYQETIRR